MIALLFLSLLFDLVAKTELNYRTIVHAYNIKIMHFSNSKHRYRAYYLRDNMFVVGTSALPIYYIINII